ncbi:MAG: hypothetical protein LQ340_006191 [Diploschistes diacapsis]|nr:MAG: hypothetical protein LQ340_006191 [Diploschistes diacapsis]
MKNEMDEKGLAVGDVESVKERVHPLVMELTSKRCPKDGLEGKFSVFHGSAVGLLFGKAGPAQYADEIVTDSNVIELRDRIQAEADERLRTDEVVVEVELKGGEKLSKHVEHAIGSLEVPMSDEQLEEKFVDQCELVLGREEAEEVSEAAWKIGEVEDAVEIIKRL